MRTRARRGPEADTEINLVPIMNMFLVLIPFLMMSATFYHLKGINTSVPVQTERSAAGDRPGAEAKVTVVVELQAGAIRLSALCDTLGEAELRRLESTLEAPAGRGYPFGELSERLLAVKREYPRSDTLLVIPEGSVLYETIIRTMDAARSHGPEPLFPNVVLSGKVG